MRAFPIHNDDDLDRAIELIDALWDAELGSPEADLLEVMSTLVDLYEAARSDLPAADPIELIQFKLTELGWSQRELGRRLGWGSGRVSEVLSGRRDLTLAMVRELSSVLSLPAGLLVHDVRDDSVLAAETAAFHTSRDLKSEIEAVLARFDGPGDVPTAVGAGTGPHLKLVSGGRQA